MARKRVVLLLLLVMTASVATWAQPTTPAPDEMKSNVVKVLRTSNKAQVNQYVCKVFEVRNCNPFEIINFPELLAEGEEGMIYTFIHPDGNKGKILVTCPEYQLPYFEQLIASLDRSKITSAPGSKYSLYRAKNRSAQFLARYAGYYGGSEDIYFPDTETNSVLCFGVPSGCDSAEAAMGAVDVPTPQALIEVTVYDVKLNNDGTFGFDFHAWKNGPGRALIGAGVRYQWLGINKIPGLDQNGYYGASSHGQGFYLDYASAYFDFLVERGKAKVLTSTKLAAMNYQPAHFSTGEQTLFYRVTQNNVLDRKVTGATQATALDQHVLPLAPAATAALRQTLGLTPAPSQVIIRPVRTGVSLDVLPVINQALIEMDIVLREATLTGYDDRGQPVLSSRQIADNVQVAPGEALIIGGLVRERKAEITRKIPILGSIPVLGWAFGGEIGGAEKTMVVAVVKPTVQAFDSPVTAADRDVMMAAGGARAIAMPQTPYGFDQWLFDRGQ